MQALGISEGDGVFALGFPLGIVGGERNFVIARNGSIARSQDLYANESKTFLIEASVFPGQSGGAVITRPEVTALEGASTIDRSLLIGVVAAYVPYRDTAVSVQTGRPRIIFEENSGLARVYPVAFIRDAIATVPSSEETAPVEEAPPAPDDAGLNAG